MEPTITSRIHALQLPPEQFIVCGSGILNLLGIRHAVDIDLLVSPELFTDLMQRGWVVNPKYPDTIEHPDAIASAKLHLEFMREDYTLEELLPKAYIQDDIRFMSLETLCDAKLQMGREKDFKDIELIDAYRSK